MIIKYLLGEKDEVIELPDKIVRNWFQEFHRFYGWEATKEDLKQTISEAITGYWEFQEDQEELDRLKSLNLEGRGCQTEIIQEDIDEGYYDPKLAEGDGDLKVYEGE